MPNRRFPWTSSMKIETMPPSLVNLAGSPRCGSKVSDNGSWDQIGGSLAAKSPKWLI
jgi:hypothetical protein